MLPARWFREAEFVQANIVSLRPKGFQSFGGLAAKGWPDRLRAPEEG